MTIQAPTSRALSSTGSLPEAHDTLVDRLRRGLADADLDCDRREAANEMLDRVSAEQELIRRADALVDARRMRDAIVLVLALLGELEDLMPDEPDRTAFDEIAGLFTDIADFANCGADAARRAAGEGSR